MTLTRLTRLLLCFQPITHFAEEIISTSNACGVNTTNLQISQELCLPGYIMARCKHVVRTGERPTVQGCSKANCCYPFVTEHQQDVGGTSRNPQLPEACRLSTQPASRDIIRCHCPACTRVQTPIGPTARSTPSSWVTPLSLWLSCLTPRRQS